MRLDLPYVNLAAPDASNATARLAQAASGSLSVVAVGGGLVAGVLFLELLAARRGGSRGPGRRADGPPSRAAAVVAGAASLGLMLGWGTLAWLAHLAASRLGEGPPGAAPLDDPGATIGRLFDVTLLLAVASSVTGFGLALTGVVAHVRGRPAIDR